jgi:hypothetical protein
MLWAKCLKLMTQNAFAASYGAIAVQFENRGTVSHFLERLNDRQQLASPWSNNRISSSLARASVNGRTMHKNLDISYEQMRSLVLEALRSKKADQFAELREVVAEVAKVRGLMVEEQQSNRVMSSNRGLTGPDFARVQSIVWDLIIEGIVRPGLNDGTNNNLPFFHATDWGRKVIQDGAAVPYDPDGYLSRLKRDIPNLDPVIETYLNESLHTFRIGCLLSSTVALGCASEKALLVLIEVYAKSLSDASQKKFRANTEGRMIKRQFDEFRRMLDSELRSRLPNNLQEGLEVELNAIFDIIRNQRNEAGHPTGKGIERERAYANLVVVPVYFKKVYSIIEWLESNAPGQGNA